MSHAHLPSLRGDPEGSPWLLLPGVVLVLAAIITLVIVASFVIADLVAGRWY
ncbi:MAG TPA: hypothetical protein VLN26_13400 [Gaiellaceae bacterium]|nr:hypothetical protein [Gaiellaceae bacterium]